MYDAAFKSISFSQWRSAIWWEATGESGRKPCDHPQVPRKLSRVRSERKRAWDGLKLSEALVSD